MTMNRRILIVLLISLLWGSEWLFNEELTDVPRVRLLSLRCLIAALALVPWAVRSVGRIPLLKSLLLGAIVIALPALLLATRTDLSPGLVVLLFATMPLMTSLLEGGSGIAHAPALLGGIAGIAFLVRPGLSLSLAQSLSGGLLLLALLATSLSLVRAKQWLLGAGVAHSLLVQMLTAAVLFGGYSLFREGASRSQWTGASAVALLSLGVFGGAIGYVCYYWLLKGVKASQSTVVQWLIPLVGIGETAIRFKQLPTWDSLLGGMLTILCAWFLLRAPANEDTPLTLEITASPQHENASLRAGSS
jgi:drug/metabolite transporter (DMT)-like permease